MQLRNLIKPEGKIFLKSEWGPAGSHWPAVAFSKRSVGNLLQREFQPGRDIIVYVGTGNPLATEDPRHRQRLLSAVSVEPQQILQTRDCIPGEVWDQSQEKYRGRWSLCFPALHIFEIENFPSAYDVIPNSYRLFGRVENRGNIIQVEADERESILGVTVIPVDFVRPDGVGKFKAQRALLNLTPEIRWEIGRMVGLILERVAVGGMEQTRMNPVRKVDETGLHILFGEKWQEQNGLCFLCNGPLVPKSGNYLLQPSVDRINSEDVSYGKANTSITHLGCNLAKNKCSTSEFEDWLAVVRGDPA